MGRKVNSLPALIAVQGNPYLIDFEDHEAARDGDNIYPELAPGWDGAPLALDDVDDGETIEVLGRRYLVNMRCGELVALALPGESEYFGPEDGEDAGTCSACGAMMETGYPVRPWCPNGPHTLEDYEGGPC